MIPIRPGRTIGILGGGQLGRLLALAAANMGYQSHIFCPEKGCPAALASSKHTCASYSDLDALDRFAETIDVATFEFENVPASTVQRLSQSIPVRPSWKALEVAQNRAREKEFFESIGVATAPWYPIQKLEDLRIAIEEISTPAILKTSRLGYDGKGQIRIDSSTTTSLAWDTLTNGRDVSNEEQPFAILEGLIEFTSEISVIAARGWDNNVKCFEPVENVHQNHILHTTTAPACITRETANIAMRIAEKTAKALSLIGLVAVEMFVTKDNEILVNEIAPRPHNSGHWTLDACQTDQFTQLVRAICGLPLADPLRHSNAIMTNLIGEEIKLIEDLYIDPRNHVYVYGKESIRPGRKMGHFTRLTPIS